MHYKDDYQMHKLFRLDKNQKFGKIQHYVMDKQSLNPRRKLHSSTACFYYSTNQHNGEYLQTNQNSLKLVI